MEGEQSTMVLRELARKKREEWESLQRERRRIDVLMHRCREYLESLNKLLSLEGLPTIPLVSDSSTSKGFARGNKSPSMPLRRAEFENLSLPEAARIILEASPDRSLHANEVTERIYEIKGPADMRKAKQSLVSTLVGGAKKGMWQHVAPNTFAANPQAIPSLFDDNHQESGTEGRPVPKTLSTAS